jgi:hypothetical protein
MNDQGTADNHEQVAGARLLDRRFQDRHWKRFSEKYDIGLYGSRAADTKWRKLFVELFENGLHGVPVAAFEAIDAPGVAMQFEDRFASRHLVQSIDVLSDHGLQDSASLQVCQSEMARVGPGPGNHGVANLSEKTPEIGRIGQKLVDIGKLVRIVSVPDPIVTPVGGDTAFGRYPRARENHQMAGLFDGVCEPCTIIIHRRLPSSDARTAKRC